MLPISKDQQVDALVESFVESNVNPVFAIMNDFDHTVAKTSIRAEIFTAMVLSDIIGKPFIKLFPAAYKDIFNKILKNAIHEQRVISFSIIPTNTNNETFYLDLHVSYQKGDSFDFLLVQCNDRTKDVLSKQKIERINIMLTKHTITDELTGLNNWDYFKERFDTEVKISRLYDQPISFIKLEIDTDLGLSDDLRDKALIHISQFLQNQTSITDVCSRLDENSLGIGCPETTLDEAISIANAIQHYLVNVYPKSLLDQSQTVTASFGISTKDFNDEKSTYIIKKASTGLKQVKEKGPNQIFIEECENIEVHKSEKVLDDIKIQKEIDDLLAQQLF